MCGKRRGSEDIGAYWGIIQIRQKNVKQGKIWGNVRKTTNMLVPSNLRKETKIRAKRGPGRRKLFVSLRSGVRASEGQ